MNPRDTTAAADLPLAGIRVIDFTQVMMGPVCTQMLGDYGADVIKIERAGAGDLSRATFAPKDGVDNPVFCSLNRNKRSVALDLRNAEQMAAVKALIAGADVVVNNFRAGVMDRMGLGYDDCHRLNPRFIYAVGTGYGETGPYAHKGGQDVLAQAMSGAMARKADPSHPLATYPTALADYSAGMHLVQGILLALLQRARTGAHSRSCASSRCSQRSRGRVRKRSRSWRCSSALCANCCSRFAKRASSDRSGNSSAAQMSRSGLALKAPINTSGWSAHSNTPDNGIAAQLRSVSRIMIIAASCICIASIEL